MVHPGLTVILEPLDQTERRDQQELRDLTVSLVTRGWLGLRVLQVSRVNLVTQEPRAARDLTEHQDSQVFQVLMALTELRELWETRELLDNQDNRVLRDLVELTVSPEHQEILDRMVHQVFRVLMAHLDCLAWPGLWELVE